MWRKVALKPSTCFIKGRNINRINEKKIDANQYNCKIYVYNNFRLELVKIQVAWCKKYRTIHHNLYTSVRCDIQLYISDLQCN